MKKKSKIVERVRESDSLPKSKLPKPLLSREFKERVGVSRMPSSGGMHVAKIEKRTEGTGKRDKGVGPENVKMVTYMQKSHFYNPMSKIANAIRDAMDPEKVKESLPPKVKTLADMTDEEKESIIKRTGSKICGRNG